MLSVISTKLIFKTALTENVFLLKFQLLIPQEFHFIPGQYMMLSLPQIGGNNLARLYSIASANDKLQEFELIIEKIPNGIASNYLSNLNIEDKVNFQGPAGVFMPKNNNHTMVFLITGTGISPARSIITSIKEKNIPIYLFWGLKTVKDVYLLQDFVEMQKNNSCFRFKICLSREINLDSIPIDLRRYFYLGHIDKALEEMKHQIDGTPDYYVCGNREMVETMRNLLLTKGVYQEQIVSEKF